MISVTNISNFFSNYKPPPKKYLEYYENVLKVHIDRNARGCIFLKGSSDFVFNIVRCIRHDTNLNKKCITYKNVDELGDDVIYLNCNFKFPVTYIENGTINQSCRR